MDTQTLIDDRSEFPASALAAGQCAQANLVETRLSANGRSRFRIKGVAMAWCNSVGEACRVANILIRAGRSTDLDSGLSNYAA